MKCLLFNSDEIIFLQSKKSSRPEGIQSFDDEEDNVLHRDVAVAFVCVVEDDTIRDVQRTAKSLCEYSDMVKRSVLLVPFAHLDNCPAGNKQAKPLLVQLKNICRQRGILEASSSFGYHKSLIAKWVTLSHEGSVAFRDSRYRKRTKREVET